MNSTDMPPTEARTQRTTASPREPDPEILIIGRPPRAPRTMIGAEAWSASGADGWLCRTGREVGGGPGHDGLQDRLADHARRRLLAALAVLAILVTVLVAECLTADVGAPGTTRHPDVEMAQADTQRLRQLTRTENQALVTADTDMLASLLAVDFTAALDGENWSRGRLIAALGSGDLDVRSVRINEFGPEDPIQVLLDRNLAIVTYQAEIEIATHPLALDHDCACAERDSKLRTLRTDTWVKSDAGWRQLRAQTNPVHLRDQRS
ncbi:nuclear transport factor 2 family protein [Microlunatus ginsengisoli]|uniref:DUF4440 domain-containing protein n=1 Tax=Microlunatus ginsengisoli TaxID=363863 RepID=A0ABP6ZK84_9ACTN